MDNAWGYVNGEAVYSRDEWIYKIRHFGAIESDEELLEYARKVSGNWSNAGWHRTFETYYLSDYAGAEPYRSLTKVEFERLKKLQQIARKKAEEADKAREWRYVETIYWADNSVEEIWEDKDGIRKTVTVVHAHGDVC